MEKPSMYDPVRLREARRLFHFETGDLVFGQRFLSADGA